jgi:2-polyprenyl-6-methoxyphenol hydroxylase-like FAD-dependent oxidoreductase
MHKLLNGGKIFAMSDEKSLIVSSKGDGSLVFYPGFKKDENWARECGIDFADKAQVIAWFKQEYAGWDDIWLELFENASSAFIPRPQYCMPLDQTWEALPNLTMLGDAAHLMPPYAGEGVNMAMLDALELSQCLLSDHFTDLQSAIAAYEKQMRARASETARETLESTAALHSPDAIAFMLSIIS